MTMVYDRTPGGQTIARPSFCIRSKNRFERRAYLPYGVASCTDGREVLFNRFYEAIWQRYPNQPPTVADPTQPVCGDKRWFYTDRVSETDSRKAGIQALADWGLLD